MIVKIGMDVFDSSEQPIMLVLNKKDKENISNMLPEATKYCAFPAEGFSEDEIKIFMEIEE